MISTRSSGGRSAASNSNEEENPLVKERNGQIRDIARQVCISLSSCKLGFGVENLIDGRIDTFWQSDGSQPHSITLTFRRRTEIYAIYLYVDYKQDESYTPSRLSIRSGNNKNEMEDIEEVELYEPTGWVRLAMNKGEGGKCLRTWKIQIIIICNHQNGRDTHIRQIKIYSPVRLSWPIFDTAEFAQFSTIR